MLYIHHAVSLTKETLALDGKLIQRLEGAGPGEAAAALYRSLGISYPKFFKMDILSKTLFLAAEVLMQAVGPVDGKDQVATVITTASGCMEVDEQFEASRADIASPALFVYTLPNIMLGELCIRHKFKGEQMCTLGPALDIPFTTFYIQDLIARQGASACLCGFAESYGDHMEARLIWVSDHPGGLPFDQEQLQALFC